MITFIYTLSDNQGIRYVGKSNNPTDRLRHHKKESKKLKSHKDKWISKMLAEGESITLEILEEVSDSEWIKAEEYWIGQLRTWDSI